jgi:hypothetical protein
VAFWPLEELKQMESPYDKRNTIQKAAQLAMGTRLNGLYAICENQKTISTAKLELYLNALHEGMKLDAIHFRALADKMES